MRHVVYGTAGHIDHGKTALVRALTGTDCDRLPEERERGITIELGFARLEGEGKTLHFVDVPGHEKLVHTMIAGASGIDLALLVVAADEGVMPQTREHLEVIRLMGVSGGAVALSKIDLVDEETADFAVEEIREILQGTAFEDAPILPVSARSGQGIEALRNTLFEQAEGARPHDIEGRPFREPVDRVFSLAGAGTVITGTSLWGKLESGATVELKPGDISARVRRMHVHGEERGEVEAGERVALNLAGLKTSDCPRGAQIISPGPWRTTRLVTLRLELLKVAPGPLDEGDEIELHALGARTPGRIDRLAERPLRPGAGVNAQISLEKEMLLFPGDRIILRRPSPVNTFAGGQVLDSALRRFKRRDAAGLADRPPVHRRDWPELVERWILEAGLEAPTPEDLRGRLGLLPDAAEALMGQVLARKKIRVLSGQPPLLVGSEILEKLLDEARQDLSRRLEEMQLSNGIPARDFMNGLLATHLRPYAGPYLELLQREGVLDLREGRVLPPGASAHMQGEGAEMARRLEEFYRERGVDPPPSHEAAHVLNFKPAAVEGVCKFLTERGVLLRLDGKWLIHRKVLEEISASVRSWDVDDFGVGEFKDRFQLTRKLAIPILEWLDSERVTIRVGNRRRIFGRRG